MKLPFPRSYWVEPGHLLAGFYPGDRDRDQADQKMNALLDCKVSSVINLMEPDEVDHHHGSFVPYDSRLQELAAARCHAVRCRRFPIVDRTAPTVAYMRTILADLASALERKETVYVHCWGGRGRTGTVVGCYLCEARRLSGPAALEELKRLTAHTPPAFWPAPEMSVQQDFVRSWKTDA
jgi:hypothetical protein